MPRWIVIEGVVGTGKTTTAKLIGANLKIPTILEEVERHPFLDDYYRDPGRFALETELAFMAIHLHQIKQASHLQAIVSDFSPAKNPIYGEVNLSVSDAAFLRRTDEQVWEGLPRPDIAIFLDVPAETCLKRVRLRGRPMEQGLTLEQLAQLHRVYMAGLECLAGHVVRLELDGRESPEEVAALASQHIEPA
jgi:deoxyguanosine kinase